MGREHADVRGAPAPQVCGLGLVDRLDRLDRLDRADRAHQPRDRRPPVTALLVAALPPAASVALILAGCLLRRPTTPAIRVPAQAGPPDSRSTPTPGAAP